MKYLQKYEQFVLTINEQKIYDDIINEGFIKDKILSYLKKGTLTVSILLSLLGKLDAQEKNTILTAIKDEYPKMYQIVSKKISNEITTVVDSTGKPVPNTIIDKSNITSKISRKVDDFTDEITIRTPYNNNIIFFKIINGSDTIYYLNLRTKGITLNSREKGVIILFTDGSKWSSTSARINVDIFPIIVGKNNYWEYSTFIRLTEDDIQTFKTKEIKKYRLFIYDEVVNPKDAQNLKSYISTIINMN